MKISNHKKVMAIAVLLAVFACVPAIKMQGETLQQEKKEKKEKKEKPPYNWLNDRPEKLSGMKNLDDYILYCDTIYDRIQTYRDSIHFYRDTMVYVNNNGKICQDWMILDDDGNPQSFSGTFRQDAEFITTGLSILTDVALIAAMNTNAALDLASNPLAALTYGKCLRGGPKIMDLAFKEVKEIINKKKEQNAAIKRWSGSGQEGSTDTQILIAVDENDEIPDIDSLPLFKPDGTSPEDLPDDSNMEELN